MGLLDPSWFQDKFLEQSDGSALIPNDSMTRVLATLPKVIEKITSFNHSRFRELTKRAFIIKRKDTNQYVFQLFSLSVLRWMMIRSPSKFRLCKFVYFSAGIVELTSTRSITDYGDTNYEKAMDLSLLREFEVWTTTLDFGLFWVQDKAMIRRCSQMLKLADFMTRVLASKSANTFLIETIGMSTLDLYWSNMSCQNRTLYQKELRKSRNSFTMFIYKRGCVTFRESRRKKIDRVPKSAGKIQNFQVLIVIIIITYRDCALG